MQRVCLGLRVGALALALVIPGCDTPQQSACASENAGSVSCGSGGRARAGESGGTGSELGDGSQTAPRGTGGLPDAGGQANGSVGSGAAGHSTTGTVGAGGNVGARGTGGAAGTAGTHGNSGTGGDRSAGGYTATDGDAATGEPAIEPVTCAALGALSTCGNGVVDPGEQCDGPALRGLSCATVDPFFTGGTLRCSPSSCTLDTNECTHGTCGNGVIDPGEDCEYANFNQTTCDSVLPGSGGALVGCSVSTCRYDLTNCSGVAPPVCGNGKRESGEQCDGEDWMRRSCVENSTENTGGQLHCDQATCMLDFTQCTRCDGSRCGDGKIDRDEECDGSNLGAYSCADAYRIFGTVSCLSNCNVDYSQCHGGCTVFKGHIGCD